MNNADKEQEIILDQNFWNFRWENQLTGWDIGEASPAIVSYFEQVENKSLTILIPGCGNAHEAKILLENGFTDITLVDIAPKAVELLKAKFAANKEVKVICDDFFNHQGQYDRVVEQTFFCTMPLSRRDAYVRKVKSLLKPNGQLVGVLFNHEFEQQGPPFGGTDTEYQALFSRYLSQKTLAPCHNSIPPRAGSELFINFIKK